MQVSTKVSAKCQDGFADSEGRLVRAVLSYLVLPVVVVAEGHLPEEAGREALPSLVLVQVVQRVHLHPTLFCSVRSAGKA